MIPKLKITFLLLIPVSCFAQNFAPGGAVWHYTPWCDCLEFGAGHFEIDANSTDSINGMACSVLEWFDFDIGIAEAAITVCENENRVYYLEDDTLLMLFDFNLEENDTLLFHIPEQQQYYDITCCDDPHNPRVARAVVTEVRDTIIDGVTLKIQETEPVFSDLGSDNFSVWYLGTIMERIGPMSGIFGYGETCCLAGTNGELRCYSDDDFEAVFVDYGCTPYGIEGAFLSELKITPTITTQQISLSTTAEYDEVRIFDLHGRVVYQNGFTNAIDVSVLNSGLYYVILYNDDAIAGRGYFEKTGK